MSAVGSGRPPVGAGPAVLADPSPQAVSTVPALVPDAWQPWETAPKDGTPFCVGHTLRYNPFGKHWEGLFIDRNTGERTWEPYSPVTMPTAWIDRPATAKAAPNPSWFAVTFEFTYTLPPSWFERVLERCGVRWLLAVYRGVHVDELTAAADRSPEGGDPQGLHAQHESPVGNAEPPTP